MISTNAFDIFSYLNDKSILYSTSGKNISSNWVAINCIYPICSDNNFHLGINLQSKLHYCWKCGNKGNPVKLVKEIENCSWYEAKKIVEQYQNFDLISPDKEEEINISRKLVWPKEFELITPSSIPKVVFNYLSERNFDPDQIIRKHNLFYPGLLGDYKYRLIIPIESKRKIVNFTARALSNRNPLSYKTCPNEKAEIDINDLLYGYDDIQPESPIVIVEGIFDQWRLGAGSVAIFKSELTPTQVSLIREKKPSKVFILLDEDTLEKEKPEKIANKLWFCPTEIIEIGIGDPAMMSQSEASYLMGELQ
jgi:DNA primase